MQTSNRHPIRCQLLIRDTTNRSTVVDKAEINSSRRYLMVSLSLSAFAAAYALGIWLGLWNTYHDSTPSWGRVHFALLITAIPCLLPLTMNIVSIPLMQNQQYKPAGILLLVCSIVFATLIGVFIVPMSNF